MPYQGACKDAGMDCDFVAKGETIEEVVAKAVAHGKAVHNFTDTQLKDPNMQAAMKAAIKKV